MHKRKADNTAYYSKGTVVPVTSLYAMQQCIALQVLCAVQARQKLLVKIAEAIESNEQQIMEANESDVQASQGKISENLMQRLRLKPQKIKQLAEGIRAIARQDEPIGKVR